MNIVQPVPNMAIANDWQEYRLLDTGHGMKMEKWGPHTLVRPDPQVIWPRRGGPNWEQWDGLYHRSEKGGGRWEYRNQVPEKWNINYKPLGLKFRISPTSFKHPGLFPEQAVNWQWCTDRIKDTLKTGRPVNVLNLFGYTGGATCAAAKAGASVCHVDAAEGMVKWCRENANLSGLNKAPIRFITDDCLKFVRREIRRGKRYDGIIMDPPTYGRGTGGQMWKLEDHLWELLSECGQLLSDQPAFFLINAYTARLSPTVVTNLLSELMHKRKGTVTGGEVGLPIESDGKILPCGVYGRWQPTL